MKYVKLDETTSGLTTYFETNELNVGVGYASEEKKSLFYRLVPEPYALKFIAHGEQTLSINAGTNNASFEFSYDGENWSGLNQNEELTFGTQEHPFVYVRGYCPTGFIGEPHVSFGSNNSLVEIEGNILSLINYQDQTITGFTSEDATFYGLFEGESKLYKCDKLIIGREDFEFTQECCSDMFHNCESLITPPQLPATTLAKQCYEYMFGDCTSLAIPPELPATTLTDRCYHNMFRRCSALTTAPLLPATTLAVRCYQYMFYDCTSLSAITCLATNISAVSCTNGWVNGVPSGGTFTKASSMTDWTTGESGIPTGWTVVNAS